MSIETYCDIMNKIRKNDNESMVTYCLTNGFKYSCPACNVSLEDHDYIILLNDDSTKFINVADIVAICI